MLQYAFPIFLGAFLLFQVQPIIARCILPWFGGMPAVWTTCMLFFQVLLLGGYAYAHFVATRLRPWAQSLLQGVVVAAALAAMALQTHGWGGSLIPDASWKPTDVDAPVFQILRLLGVAVGLPYFVLATTSPLLQAWFARARPGVSPYRLYMLSNVGSLLALLSYPVLIEPALAMRAQAAVWSGAFVLFAVAYLVCAVRSAGSRSVTARTPVPEEEEGEAPAWRDRLIWVALPALASTMLLAVTNQICQELAVIPFLWILPLTLYLLSFIICFDNPRWYARAAYLPAMLVLLPVVAYIMTRPLDTPVRWQILAYVAMLFVACMFCHGEVVARRPHPRHLTGFYLAISIGGAVGGLFVGLLAPVVFKRFYELHVGLAACWLLGVFAFWRWQRIADWIRGPVTLALIICSIGLVAIYHIKHHDDDRPVVLLSCRNFYGVFRVEDRDRDDFENEVHSLVHGATIHGLQYMNSDLRYKPVSYYSPRSGVGLAITHHPRYRSPQGGAMRIGVVGLGTGNLAIYGRAGDTVRFYEINPAIDAMAHDAQYFTYLSDSRANVDVVMGDARLSLERELREGHPQQFDVLVLDAFSSDSIPAHLLTKEAFAVYLQHLRQPDGVIAVHVSNRFLDLKRVAYALSDYYGQSTRRFSDPGGPGVYKSDWMLLTNSVPLLSDPELVKDALPRKLTRPLRLWTDDYYNLFQILR